MPAKTTRKTKASKASTKKTSAKAAPKATAKKTSVKATAKKTSAKIAPKATTKKTSAMAVPNTFPKRELNSWLKKNNSWDHGQWLALVNELSTKGFTDLLSNQEGLDAVGLYLESNKK